VLIAGDYAPINEDAQDYLAFLRRTEEQTCLVVLNMSERPQAAHFDLPFDKVACLFSSREREGAVLDVAELHLRPFEVFIGQLV
jgi:hypothetical protein